jgi:hypothetical protein
MNNLRAEEFEKMIALFNEGKINANDLVESMSKLSKEGDNVASSQHNLNSELDQLKEKVTYFFGLTNAVNLLRKALNSAFETVKELDAAMTETAVVTDFSIGDMWDKLPEYSVQATKLGTSIKSLYEASTLYYQ